MFTSKELLLKIVVVVIVVLIVGFVFLVFVVVVVCLFFTTEFLCIVPAKLEQPGSNSGIHLPLPPNRCN